MIKTVRILTFFAAIIVTLFSLFYVDADQEFAHAQRAFRNGDMDQALRMSRRANLAFSATEQKVRAYFLQASASLKMNWTKKAKDYLNQLLLLESKNARALLLRGEINLQLGETQNALQDLNKGLILLPENSSNKTKAYYHSQRGLTFLVLSQVNEAEKDAQKALKLSFNLPESHDLMSKVLEEKGEIKGALEECEKAYQLSIAKDKLSFMSPKGQKLSERLVNLRVKNLQLK